MTTYNWSALTNNQQITFDAINDKLVFDDPSLSIANVSFNFGGGGTTGLASYVNFSARSTNIKLYMDVKEITTLNIKFASGSQIIIGDNTSGIVSDDAPNTLTGSEKGDLLIGFGGNDTINGLGGDDVISIGTWSSFVGDDEIDGGSGIDTLTYPAFNNPLSTVPTPAVIVDLRNHSVMSSQGSHGIRNIEKVFGTASADTFIAGAIEHKIDSLGNITNEIFRGNGGDDTITGVARDYGDGVIARQVGPMGLAAWASPQASPTPPPYWPRGRAPTPQALTVAGVSGSGQHSVLPATARVCRVAPGWIVIGGIICDPSQPLRRFRYPPFQHLYRSGSRLKMGRR